MKGRDLRIVSEILVKPVLMSEGEETDQKQRKIRKQPSDDDLFHENKNNDNDNAVYNENENQKSK